MTTTDPLRGIGTIKTPQSEPVPGRDQVKNNAGGFVFEVTPMTQLRRFLTMGTAGGTYYVGERELTRENAGVVIAFTGAEADHHRMVDAIVEISVAGRAPKPNPALFALAVACQLGDTPGKQYARQQITKVVRTGTHLFIFVGYLKQFGGWSRGLRREVGKWYTEKSTDDLSLQLIKYRQREGYTHRDVLRLTHPKIEGSGKRAAIDWVMGAYPKEVHGPGDDSLPDFIRNFEAVQDVGNSKNIPEILEHNYLPWEALPDSAMNDVKVWDKLLDNGMPINALVRQLPRLTKLGVISPMGGRTNDVTFDLMNADMVRKSRIHPIQVLTALKTYKSGRGMSSEWVPVPAIVDALDEMFYLSFGNVEATGKRTMNCLDVSASMTWNENMPPRQPLTCREISAALAMVTVRTEPHHMTVAFTSAGGFRNSALTHLPLSARQRLDDVVGTVGSLYAGGTDCSLPMMIAQQEGYEIDTFVIYTDNDTWAGNIHPYQALKQYRKASGIDAKLVVVSMTPSRFSIADPRDPGMLDISGFDSAIPTFISDFSAGRS